MRRITVCQMKGGVAKSTTAATLASGLAKKNYKVLLVDTDTTAGLNTLLGIEPELGLADFLIESSSFEESIIEARENLWLLSGGGKLGGIKKLMSSQEMDAEYVLTEALEKHEKQFDFVIIDTGPGYDILTINILVYSKEIIAPVTPEVLTLRSFQELQKRVDIIRKRKNPDLEIKYILPTVYDLRVKKSEAILNGLQKKFPKNICSPIPYNVSLSHMAAHGKTIWEYDPHSKSSAAYIELIKRVLNG